MGDPQAPGLPNEAPADLRDFVDCKGTTVSIAGGEFDWVLPEELKALGKPEVTFKPGKAAGTVTITIDFDWTPAVDITGTIANGQLTISLSPAATKLLPAAIRKALDDWVAALSSWLKQNGWQFGAPVVKDGTLTLTKVPIAGSQPGVAPKPAGTPKPATTPQPGVTPKPGTGPAPGAAPTPGGKTEPPKPPDPGKPGQPTKPHTMAPGLPTFIPPDVVIPGQGQDEFQETPIPQPDLKKSGEVFPNPMPPETPPPKKIDPDQLALGPTDATPSDTTATFADVRAASIEPVATSEETPAVPGVDQGTVDTTGDAVSGRQPALDIARDAEGRVIMDLPALKLVGPEPRQLATDRGPSRTAVVVAGVAAGLGGLLLGAMILGGGTPGAATPTPTQAAVVAPSVLAATPSPVREVTPSRVAVVTPSPTPSATPSPTPRPTPTPPPTPSFVETIIEYLESLGVDPSETGAVMEASDTDASGDQFAPDGGTPATQPGVTDIQRSGIATVEMLVPLVEAEPNIRILPEDFLPGPGTYGFYYVETDEALEQLLDAGYDVGIAYLDETPLDGSIPDPWDGGPSDPLRTMNTSYVARFPPPGTAPSLERVTFTRGEDAFEREETAAFALYSGNVLGIFIPEVEWDGAASYRAFTTYADLTSDASVRDTWPDIAEDSQVVPDELLVIEVP